MNTRWLVSGVGRSGTTLLYSLLYEVAKKADLEMHAYYEPYLWGDAAWDKAPANFDHPFITTGSYNPKGLSAHMITDLFTSETNFAHQLFLSEILPEKGDVLLKVIRGAGRLELFLEHDPDLKVLHIIRNPLDVVNSALGQFSVFGDEFHPSDRDRFLTEIEKENLAGSCVDSDQSEAQWTAAWWQSMNQAALQTAEKYPDRIAVLPYETFVQDPKGVFENVLRFLGAPDFRRVLKDFKKPVGPVTKKPNLGQSDFEAILPLFDEYFAKMQSYSAFSPKPDFQLAKSKVLEKYDGKLHAGAFVPTIDRHRGPLALRRDVISLSKDVDALTRDVAELRNDVKEAQQTQIKTERFFQAKVKRLEAHRLALKYRLDLFLLALTKRRGLSFKRKQEEIVSSLGVLDNSRLLKLLGPLSKSIFEQVGLIRRKVVLLSEPADVTCVVTSYNNKPFIKIAIESVLAQTRPLEKIVVADDCSTDGSQELLKSIASKHPQISLVLREKNLGPGLNRHLSFLDVSTTHLSQLDGDDTIAPDKFALEANVLGAKRDGIAYSDFVMQNKERMSRVTTADFSKLGCKEERIKSFLLRDAPLPHNMTYSKELYVESGGYDKSAKMYEDWSLKLRLANIANDWHRADTVGLIYNRHGAGLSSAEREYHWYWQAYCLGQNFHWLKSAAVPKVLRGAVLQVGKFIQTPELAEQYHLSLEAVPETEAGIEAIESALNGLLQSTADVKSIENISALITQFIADLKSRG